MTTFTRTRAPLQVATALTLGVFALSGCFDDGSGVTIPDDSEQATVEGRVEQGMTGSALMARAADVRDPAAQTAAEATVATVVAVEADGSLTTLASADIQADGSFSVTGVPAGRTNLQVVARTDADAEVGRVLVQGETQGGATVTVAPIVPETTVEGRTAVRLRADGEAAAQNSGELSLFVRMDATAASSVASSSAEIQAMADAFVASQAYADAAAAEVAAALNAQTRAQVLLEAAAAYAVSRDGGASLDAAHDAFAEAALDAFLGAGADVDGLALFTAARATGAVEAAGSGSTTTQVAVAREAALLNLRARERLAADISGAPGSSASVSASALASARSQVEAATTLAEIRAAVDAAADACASAVFDGIVNVTGALDAVVETQLQAALATAMAEADLAAHLSATTTASGAAQVLASYRSDVETTVTALLAVLPDASGIDAQAVARLLVAANANAYMGS